MAPQIAFVTFGMFIIDEIEYEQKDKGVQVNLIGGAGTYAALGACIAISTLVSAVSWIVDMGSDFPDDFKQLIDSWGTSCVYRVDNSRLTTRAWNGYGPNEHRDFKYLTPKRRLEVDSLTDDQALSRSFHMVCSPSRCIDLVTKLQQRRELLQPSSSEAIVVWEPIPDLCTPAELRNLQTAAVGVSVLSTNAEELMQFFAQDWMPSPEASQAYPRNNRQDHMVLELMGWYRHGEPHTAHVIVREGARGSTIYLAPGSDKSQSRVKLWKVHLPAYHTSKDSHRVVDPTGGGNTYLGALAASMSTAGNSKTGFNRLVDQGISKSAADNINTSALHQLRDVGSAAVNAVVAASYAIEQLGVPTLGRSKPTDEGTDARLWNGESFSTRLGLYVDREKDYISRQLHALILEN